MEAPWGEDFFVEKNFLTEFLKFLMCMLTLFSLLKLKLRKPVVLQTFLPCFLLHSSYCLSVKMNVFLTIWLRNKSRGNQTCCRYPRCKLRYPWWRRSDPNPRTSSCWTDCAASKRSALPHRNSSSCIRMLLWLTRRKGPKESLIA